MEKIPIRLGHLRTRVQEATPRPVASVDIRVSNTEGPQLRAVSTGRVCRVCTTNEARYTCPRCNLPYCSVGCYRTHGDACTEQFYHDHVTNEMTFNERTTAAVDPKAERQRATAALLTRVKQFQDETSQAFNDIDPSTLNEVVELSAERLAHLALLDDAELSLESLTDVERSRFLEDLAGGRLSKFVTPWKPWWWMDTKTYEKETSSRRRKLIIEVVDTVSSSNSNEDGHDDNAKTPMIEEARFPATIFTRDLELSMPPSTATLVRGAASPSPALPFHLVEILFAYAFTMRTFNGDWKQDPEDAVLTLLHCSDVLREDGRFATLEEVLIKCLEMQDIEGTIVTATNRLVLADAVEILIHDLFAMDALSDVIELVSAAADDITRTRLDHNAKHQRTKKNDRAAVRKLHSVQKKVEFYRVWRFHNGDLCEGVSVALQAKLDEISSNGIHANTPKNGG